MKKNTEILKEILKEIFQYKKLNKRRKTYFWLCIFCGLFDIIIAIKGNDFSLAVMGLMMWIFSLYMFANQANENLLNDYDKLIDNAIKNNEENLKIISKFVKEKDWETLKQISNGIDSVYGDENKDGSKSK